MTKTGFKLSSEVVSPLAKMSNYAKIDESIINFTLEKHKELCELILNDPKIMGYMGAKFQECLEKGMTTADAIKFLDDDPEINPKIISSDGAVGELIADMEKKLSEYFEKSN